MIGREIHAPSGEALLRFVRALGQHRYVAGSLHLIHAFAIEAACAARSAGDAGEETTPAFDPVLVEAHAWSSGVLGDSSIDRASKDERLVRRATDAELCAVLAAFWLPGVSRERARSTLTRRLAEIRAVPPEEATTPFDEGGEDDIFPLLIDAGWELLPLRELDVERHKGAIAAFGEPLEFEVAKFEEENASPAAVPLHELPAIGASELLFATDAEGLASAPFVLWESGHPTYLDYVLRGLGRAAKVDIDG